MTFEEILDQAIALLQRRGRITHRTLKRQFHLDEDGLEDLKEELIYGQRLAADEDGRVLVWIGGTGTQRVPSNDQERAPRLYTPAHLTEKILSSKAALEGERKQVTVLFADLKGSMELLADRDPEEARQLLDPVLERMMAAVHRYEGTVNQVMGDGIMALFGAPIAHEDHAVRACYAALAMQTSVKAYAAEVQRTHGVPVQIRVGLNAGEVVVRSIGSDLDMDYTAVGQTTHLAARMEQMAMPGSILITADVFRLVEGYVQVTPLGPMAIKGLTTPVEVFEVVGVGPLRTRLEVAARRGLARFVGRRRELEQLQRAWEHAQKGRGQIVAVVGGAGVGKSRLCYEFKHLAQRGCLVLETISVSHGKAYPYLPVIELLKHYCQVTPQDDERRRREQVTGKVLTLDRGLEDTLSYLLALLGDAAATATLAPVDPPIKRRRTFEALTRLLLRESLNQPVLLLIEDLQWLDSETDAWLQELSERTASARILLLVNYRPEYQHSWGSKSYYTQLRLDPLGLEEAQELLTALLGNGAGLESLKHLILAKTEGNPFFMEELVQALADQGILARVEGGGARLIRPLMAIQVPPTVQGVLAARIDRLPAAEKALLQTLAVVGKEFPWRLLMQVVAQPDEDVHRLLSHLQGGEFIYERPAFPEPEYTFKHALTQEVAYNSLLLERRRLLHARAAQAIETLFGDQLEDYYHELAHHYLRSETTEKAVEYLGRAGRQAAQRSAYVDAIGYLTTAIDLVKTLPRSAERSQQELRLQIGLGPALMATKGFGAPEVEHVFTRARELCQEVGDTPQLFLVLQGLGGFYALRGQFQTVRELVEQRLRLAQRLGDQALLAQAHLAQGHSWLAAGEVIAARAHLEQGMALYNPEQAHPPAFGLDPKGRDHAAHVLWLLGYPEQALESLQQVLTAVQEEAHPFSLAVALVFASVLHQFRREAPLAQARAEAAMTLATEHGFAQFLAMGTLVRGWALGEQGYGEEGIAQVRLGLAAYQATGAKMLQPYFLALLAQAHATAGQVEEGLRVLAEALAMVQNTGERWWEAELYRLKGEFILKQAVGKESPPTAPADATIGAEVRMGVYGHSPLLTEAEACFRRALAVAQRQGAKSLELRAALSLVRLWQQQGKCAEARQLLAEIYDWFTEGLHTADLQEARALLKELS
jgi:class 3 adenylate cyclase/predicted ATPase